MGTHIYDTPYDKNDALNGQECTVIDSPVIIGSDSLILVRFDNHGITLHVWPEEITEKP